MSHHTSFQQSSSLDRNVQALAQEHSYGTTGSAHRALTQQRYGGFDELQLKNIATPLPREGEVQVRVHAAALHVGDVFVVHGTPWLMRVETGLFRPKSGAPGFDVAGVVTALGDGVSDLQIGDAVFGTAKGTCAEFIVGKTETLVPKPESISFAHAAALPTSGSAALHALRDAGAIQAGQRVLINGASGAVGHFAVQIARAMGAHVTGVCSTSNVEQVTLLGAHEVVDYTQADFTCAGSPYDLILDNVENRALAEVRKALTPEGTLILNSGTGASGAALLWRLIKPILLSPFSGQTLKRYLSMPNQQDLIELARMTESGTLTPWVERQWPLEQAVQALKHIEQGHARGKVVIQVRPDTL